MVLLWFKEGPFDFFVFFWFLECLYPFEVVLLKLVMSHTGMLACCLQAGLLVVLLASWLGGLPAAWVAGKLGF